MSIARVAKPKKVVVRKVKRFVIDPIEKWVGRICYAMLALMFAWVGVVVIAKLLEKESEVIYEARADEVVVTEIKTVERFLNEVPPIMVKIAKCESGGLHKKNGKVVLSRTHDVGKYQINEAVWGKKAKELGYDIYTAEGNEKMAMYIFERKGSAPWIASSKCWNI